MLARVSDLDIAVVAPTGSPGVPNDPVLLAVLRAIANNGHTVVKRGTAFSGVQDTTRVALEYGLISLDTDRHRSIGYCGLKLTRVVPSHVLKASYTHMSSFGFAFLLMRFVRVFRL